jgi:nucleolin
VLFRIQRLGINTEQAKEDDSDEAEDQSESESDEDSEDEPKDVAPAKADVPKKRKADDEHESAPKKTRMEDETEDAPPNASKNLFIGRLSWAMDDDSLYSEFKSFGEIVGCRIVYDRDSGRSKGYVSLDMTR